jgi:hypothetical protein
VPYLKQATVMDFTEALENIKKAIEELSEYLDKALGSAKEQPRYNRAENCCVPVKFRHHNSRWSTSRKMSYYMLSVLDDV